MTCSHFQNMDEPLTEVRHRHLLTPSKARFCSFVLTPMMWANAFISVTVLHLRLPSHLQHPRGPRLHAGLKLEHILRSNISRSSRLLDSPSVDYRAGARGRSRNPSEASIQGARPSSEAGHLEGLRPRMQNSNRSGPGQNTR